MIPTGSASGAPRLDPVHDEDAVVAQSGDQERRLVLGSARLEADPGERLAPGGEVEDLAHAPGS